MKPAPFIYLAPKSTEEALEFLDLHQDDVRVLAGGQSLVPMLNFRLIRFDYLLDINGIPELSYIRSEHERLHIGATTRYRTIEVNRLIQAHAPLLSKATHFVAHLPVRTRGTIGGSLAHADPAAEYPALMLVLNATMVVKSKSHTSEIAADDFFGGLFESKLSAGDLLVEIQIPHAKPTQGFGFKEYSRRTGDLALVGVAVMLDIANHVITDARIALLGLSGGVQRLLEAENHLIGKKVNEELIEHASDFAMNVSAQSDLHGTDALRKHLAKVLTKDALIEACQ
ncbi:MAG: xanthine dehydrogenase family protein subunit M [Betaproteobacteria bacterium]|jgi:hypothetical protein